MTAGDNGSAASPAKRIVAQMMQEQERCDRGDEDARPVLKWATQDDYLAYHVSDEATRRDVMAIVRDHALAPNTPELVERYVDESIGEQSEFGFELLDACEQFLRRFVVMTLPQSI